MDIAIALTHLVQDPKMAQLLWLGLSLPQVQPYIPTAHAYPCHNPRRELSYVAMRQVCTPTSP